MLLFFFCYSVSIFKKRRCVITNLLSTNHVDKLYNQIESIVENKKNKITYQINNTMLETYFLIGKLDVEQKGQPVADQLSWSHYCYLLSIEDDNETIGIILCKGKNEITMEYALGGLSNRLFASTYIYYIPNKELLIGEVEKIVKESNNH